MKRAARSALYRLFHQKSTIEKNPELVQKFTQAIYRGQQWVDSHSPEEIAKAIKPSFPDEPEEILVSAIKNYKEQNTWKKRPLTAGKGVLSVTANHQRC